MAKGRKRLPTEIKKAQGTLQPCRTNIKEPQYPSVIGLPDPPDFLGERGKSIYYETGNILIQSGVLKQVNLVGLIAYAKESEVYFEAREKINSSGMVRSVTLTNGNKVWQINPYQKIANDALANIVRLACEFGITPASRSKIIADKVETSSRNDLLT